MIPFIDNLIGVKFDGTPWDRLKFMATYTVLGILCILLSLFLFLR